MPYRRTSHAVYELNYHFVWPPKYRKHIATQEVGEFLKNLFPRIAETYGFTVLEQNIKSDHVHLFLSAPPRFSPAQIVEILKSISAKEIFKKFPKIRKELWGGELWSDGYFVRAVGDKITSFVIQRYIHYHQQEETSKQRKLF